MIHFQQSAAYAFETLNETERKRLGAILDEWSSNPDAMLASNRAHWIKEPSDMVEIRGEKNLRVYMIAQDDGWLVVDVLRRTPVLH